MQRPTAGATGRPCSLPAVCTLSPFLQGQQGAVRTMRAPQPAIPVFGRSGLLLRSPASDLPPSHPHLSFRPRLPCSLRPFPGIAEPAPGNDASLRLYGEISPCPPPAPEGHPCPDLGTGAFFVKKITNKSSHLYRIARSLAAAGPNFRILLIPAARPSA